MSIYVNVFAFCANVNACSPPALRFGTPSSNLESTMRPYSALSLRCARYKCHVRYPINVKDKISAASCRPQSSRQQAYPSEHTTRPLVVNDNHLSLRRRQLPGPLCPSNRSQVNRTHLDEVRIVAVLSTGNGILVDSDGLRRRALSLHARTNICLILRQGQ